MKNTQKLLLAVNFVLMCAVFIGNYFYLTVGGLWLKALCSSGFALMGLVNLCFALGCRIFDRRFPVCMAIGLVFACLGDIVLGYDFIIGAALFALGHIGYLTAYCLYKKPQRLDFIIGGVLFLLTGAFVMFCPLLTFPDRVMQIVCVVYALIISLMVGKAIANVVRGRDCVSVIVCAASCLFFFSDLMLVFDWFMGMDKPAGWLCMATYYPAECLLALSSLLFTLNVQKGGSLWNKSKEK